MYRMLAGIDLEAVLNLLSDYLKELLGRSFLLSISGLSGPVSTLSLHHLSSHSLLCSSNDETKHHRNISCISSEINSKQLLIASPMVVFANVQPLSGSNE